MTYSKQTRKAALTRLSKDPTKKKYDSMITVIQKGNPGDTKTINKLQRRNEQYIFGAYPELFEGKKW
jgi:hypothetical protein